MPTSAELTLVDTSVAMPLVSEDHDAHQLVDAALSEVRLGLAAHAAFEMFSVLTRLPGGGRRARATVARILSASFPDTRMLSADRAAELLAELPSSRVSGGAV